MYIHLTGFLPVDWHPQLKGEVGTMKRLILAVVLACALSGIARAGEISSTGITAPPPPNSVSAGGEIPSTGATTPELDPTLLTILLTIISIGR